MGKQPQPTSNPYIRQLKDLLTSIDAAGHAILPRSNDELLKSIVEAAAKIFSAAAASIMLVDEIEQVLVFKVSYGAANRDLVGQKFPLGKGIAGYVVMSGQPLTISNVQLDSRFNQDFAKSTGYVPKSILAMPLKSGERVLGVIEVLDKVGSATFGMQDMELLGMFAQQAAIAIDQSQKMDRLQEALILGLKNLSKSDPKNKFVDLFKSLPEKTDGDDDLLELADILYKINQLGERERRACVDVVKIFANYQVSSRKTRYAR